MKLILKCLLLVVVIICMNSCSDSINSIQDKHFTADGICTDSLSNFVAEDPNYVNFFVEVSGSMNGFFRANRVTDFKKDVWSIITNIVGTQGTVSVFTSQSQAPQQISVSDFQTRMNKGCFFSTSSTDVPTMVQYLVDNQQNGLVSVLISDMKYSPVGHADIKVLLSQYSSAIRNILKDTGLSWTLICATSTFLSNNGNVACEASPYYYWVIGDAKQVATIRNVIGIMLKREGHYVNMIDGGSNYDSPIMAISHVKGMIKENNQCCSNYDMEVDSASFVLNVDLSYYPWLFENPQLFGDALTIKSTQGCKVSLGDFEYYITDQDNTNLNRTVVVSIPVYVTRMINTADVIECSVVRPNDLIVLGNMSRFFDGAVNENQVDKSFSVLDFIKGASSVSPNQYSTEPFRVLISTTH